MTISTSCSYSNGPYQWSAMDLAVDEKHVGYGKTKDEALADLARLLNERAEHAEQAAEQDAGQGVLDLQEDELIKAVRAAKGPDDHVIGIDPKADMQWVEYLIDRHGIAWVLAAITRICDEKAEHIAVNWQDAHLAKRWTNVANAASTAAAEAVGL